MLLICIGNIKQSPPACNPVPIDQQRPKAVNRALVRARNTRSLGQVFFLSPLLLQAGRHCEKFGGENTEAPKYEEIYLAMQYCFSAVERRVERHRGSCGSRSCTRIRVLSDFHSKLKRAAGCSHIFPFPGRCRRSGTFSPSEGQRGAAGDGHSPNHPLLLFQLTRLRATSSTEHSRARDSTWAEVSWRN